MNHGQHWVRAKLASLEDGGSGWMEAGFLVPWRAAKDDEYLLQEIRTGLRNDYMDENERRLQLAARRLKRELKAILRDNPATRGFVSNVGLFLASASRYLDHSAGDLRALHAQAEELGRKAPPEAAAITREQAEQSMAAVCRVALIELRRIEAVQQAIDSAAPQFLEWYRSHPTGA